MDTVTHALIGTAIAEAGFHNSLGRKAIFAGAIFASLPDTDIFMSLTGDPLAMLKYHRAATHSILLACVAAPILGWLSWKLTKKTGTILNWSLLALLGILSHDLLDLFTTWGTEIFYPLTDRRYSLDALPIIDPLITLPLLGGFLLTIFSKRLKARTIASRAILSWCILYTLTGLFLSTRAINLVRATIPEEFEIIKEKAIPNTGTILLWNVVLKDREGDFYTASVSSLNHRVFNQKFSKSHTSQQIENVLNSQEFSIIQNSSQGLLLAAEDSTQDTITFTDMRYAMLDAEGRSIPVFFFKIFLDSRENILRVERPMPDRSRLGGLHVYLDAIFTKESSNL